jgi:hypothetical protein
VKYKSIAKNSETVKTPTVSNPRVLSKKPAITAQPISPPENKVEIGPCTLYHGDCLEVLKSLPDCSVDSVVTDPPAGINFMGREWDQAKFGRDRWIDWLEERMRECFRVLKPGGHALVWALPRTSHWTATACEDAGFEIRDRVAHIFGTGFPKNMDVSKAIDKAAGAKREVIGKGKGRTGEAAQPNGGSLHSDDSYQWPGDFDITAPATPEAAQWEGWGTALKPACEDWWLCRKPLEGTVAANVLKYGTGGLNIDACRVPTSDTYAYPNGAGGNGFHGGVGREADGSRTDTPEMSPLGRFPAHLIHDGSDEAIQGMQEASRYFYCPKASKKDRNEGGIANKHPTVKNTELMRYLCLLITPPGGTVLDPFAGSFSTGKAAVKEGFKFIGIEAEREYFDIGVERLRHEVGKPTSV